MGRICIRLYKRTDRDLINLYMNPTFNMSKAMKAVVTGFVRRQPIVVACPAPFVAAETDISSFRVDFCVSGNDSDVSEWLKDNIKQGQRNSFIKNLFRACCDNGGLIGFASNDEAASEIATRTPLLSRSLQGVGAVPQKAVNVIVPKTKREKKNAEQVRDELLEKTVHEERRTSNVPLKENTPWVVPTAPKEMMEQVNVQSQVRDVLSKPSDSSGDDGDDSWDSELLDGFDAFM